MFVPCDEAKISICDSILARIGATDDIQKNLSTFAMEMVRSIILSDYVCFHFNLFSFIG